MRLTALCRRIASPSLLIAAANKAAMAIDFASSSHRISIGRPAAYISDDLHAARAARRVLNVPFQSSIRAWMLLQAARRARSFLCGESAMSLSRIPPALPAEHEGADANVPTGLEPGSKWRISVTRSVSATSVSGHAKPPNAPP
jgi:hypothetical protein